MNQGLSVQAHSITLMPKLGSKKQFINRVVAGKGLVFWVSGNHTNHLNMGLLSAVSLFERYLQLLQWQADLAQQRLVKTGKITVIIQDGASFHRSNKVKHYWQLWQQQGLYIFFLPPYSPQMNRIEDEWLHLKRNELSAQIFEDEYDLALALIHAIKNRADKGNYSTDRFIFNRV